MRRLYDVAYNGLYRANRLPKAGSSNNANVPGGGVPLDAHPTPIRLQYGVAGVAPHAATKRTEYVVPLGRRAIIQSAVATSGRGTAPGVGGIFGTYINVKRNGDASGYAIARGASTFNAANMNEAQQIHSGVLELYEGDEVNIVTSDSSTGGTVNYNGYVVGIEFDAVMKMYGDSPEANAHLDPLRIDEDTGTIGFFGTLSGGSTPSRNTSPDR